MMTVTTASAPGKIILFGEHAVVYGHPALAVPVHEVQATCRIEPLPAGAGVVIAAPDINFAAPLSAAPEDNPLAAAVRHTLAACPPTLPINARITVTADIPVARGLGSGAAIATAVVKALGQYVGRALPPQQIADIVFAVEKIHHGTPSGIDNTVIAFGQPVFFQKGRPLQRLAVGRPLTLVIGDTGIKSQTRKVVGNLRRRRDADKPRYDGWFQLMGRLAPAARQAIEAGQVARIADYMAQNHALLQQIGVSSDELDRLVRAALEAGALGAKLSGAGRGGNMIALVEDNRAFEVTQALQRAGAAQTIVTTVGSSAKK